MKNALFLVMCTVSILFAQVRPIDLYGPLRTEGLQLVDSSGAPVQLRGISSMGLQWYPDCINQESVRVMEEEWGAELLRLALYIGEGGYATDPERFRAILDEKIQLGLDQGMYVIIDWHVLNPGSPWYYMDLAREFWADIAETYGHIPNIIFEIANEPHHTPWNTPGGQGIKQYAEEIIPIIREKAPETVIIMGTPSYSGHPFEVEPSPLSPELSHNLLYAFHFYAGYHKEDKRQSFDGSLKAFPMFGSEWGVSHTSGDGNDDFDSSIDWVDWMAGDNSESLLLSWAGWSLSDKAETSAMLRPGACRNAATQMNTENLSPAGVFFRAALQDSLDYPIYVFETKPDTITEGGVYEITAWYFSRNPVTLTWYHNGEEIENPILVNGRNFQKLRITNFSVLDTGDYHIVASNTMADLTSPQKHLRLKPYAGLEIKRVEKTPIIDGFADSVWFDTDHQNLAQFPVWSDAWTSRDLSGTFKLLWDEEYLYVWADMTDDDRVFGEYKMLSDRINIYIEVGNGKPTSYDELSYSWYFAYGWPDIWGKNAGANSVEFGIEDRGNGYFLEAAIAWSDMNYTPQVGDFLGFDIAMHDLDSDNSTVKIAWSDKNNRADQSPAAFGTIRLGEEVSEAVTPNLKVQSVQPIWTLHGHQIFSTIPTSLKMHSPMGEVLATFDVMGTFDLRNLNLQPGIYFLGDDRGQSSKLYLNL
jgi:endoglucanase